jgi:dTDP-4-dehydrorhamnose 3,5-epimerase-like enzyme
MNRIEFTEFIDKRGALIAIENFGNCPFEIKRIFYIYNVPNGQHRGRHCHLESHQLIICVNGFLKISVNDGVSTSLFLLDSPNQGLHVPPMNWTDLLEFSSDAIVLVLASEIYDVDDYILDFEDFKHKKLHK